MYMLILYAGSNVVFDVLITDKQSNMCQIIGKVSSRLIRVVLVLIPTNVYRQSLILSSYELSVIYTSQKGQLLICYGDFVNQISPIW